MTKTSLGNIETLFNSSSPFCIEISLRTPENQTMILETWCILFNDQLVDSSQKVCYNVYKKMSLVLRSLMCITRSTPTYQLSRRQSSDTYVLLYRMYCGEPIVHHLGENYATCKVGTVGTPIGSIIVNLAYRTRLTMTPQNSSHSNEITGGIQIKDDHFATDSAKRSVDSPSAFNYNAASVNRFSPTDLNEYNASPNSPPIIDKSPRGGGVNNTNLYEQSSSSSSSLSKRSSSNLNTIAETVGFNSANPDNQIVKRQSSKAQPIPARSISSQLVQQTQQSNSQALQIQRYSSDLNQINDESSADEYNSSVASTPDTIYYFKLKSAAFVPSASFTNNYHSSIGNLSNENDIPPFITLLSNDFGNLSASERQNQLLQYNPHLNEQMAQSPPPPQQNLEFNFQQNRSASRKINKNRHDSNTGPDNEQQQMIQQQMVSPCSLPNFKMLDTYNAQFLNKETSNNNFNQIASSLVSAPQPDDFVFVESVSWI